MAKEDFISGSILEFKVPHDFGFAYCKILDFRHIRVFDGVLVKVYNCIVREPISDIKILNDKDLLFGVRRMPDLPGTRGKKAWKMKGVLVAADDNIIPDFKYSIKEHLLLDDESKAGPWYVVRNLTQTSKESYPHDCVRHLEDTVISSQSAIEIRTAMECYRINGIDVSKHFDLSQTVNSIIYRQMINVPIYSSIPKEIRGKAIEHNACSS